MSNICIAPENRPFFPAVALGRTLCLSMARLRVPIRDAFIAASLVVAASAVVYAE